MKKITIFSAVLICLSFFTQTVFSQSPSLEEEKAKEGKALCKCLKKGGKPAPDSREFQVKLSYCLEKTNRAVDLTRLLQIMSADTEDKVKEVISNHLNEIVVLGVGCYGKKLGVDLNIEVETETKISGSDSEVSTEMNADTISVEITCGDLMAGKFIAMRDDYYMVKIDRIGAAQIEIDTETGTKALYSVAWGDSCMYTKTFEKYLLNPNGIPEPTEKTTIYQVKEITGTYYMRGRISGEGNSEKLEKVLYSE